MITIPDSIKNLLKSDSVYKNFRVHFPNGERADIINDNIVSESVNLTESICSQQTLMFNTCETPMIEFETIGVENVKGATIECILEIECPSTVSGAVQRADLNNMWVYPIPYGKYVITSCKKQADMTHRQVQAYNYTNYISALNPLEQAKKEWFSSSSWAVDYNAHYRVIPSHAFIVNNFSPLSYSSAEEVTSTRTSHVNMTHSFYKFYIDILCKCQDIESTDAYQYLFGIDDIPTIEQKYAQVRSECMNDFLTWDDTWRIRLSDQDKSRLRTYLNEIDILFEYRAGPVALGGGLFRSYWEDVRKRYSGNYVNLISPFFSDNPFNLSSPRVSIAVPISVTIRLEYTGGSTPVEKESQTYTMHVADHVLHQYTLPESVQNNIIVDYTNNMISLLGSYYELQGKVCRMDRQGTVEPLSIEYQLANPVDTLTPSNYSSFWYDDDMTKPYGRITCSYKNTSGEDAYAEKYIVDADVFNTKDYKTYDISNNLIIKGNQFSATTIEDILDTMASNMDAISYMPLNLAMTGRPDLEVGDVLTIETREGDEIPCLIMQRNLNGVQRLEDSITASEDDEDIPTLRLNSAYDSTSGILSISLVGGR